MDASNVTAQTAAAQLFQAMGAASSDFVDPETLPLQILIQDGQEQNGVDDKQVKDEDDEKLLRDIWELEHEKKLWRDYARQMEKERDNLFHFGPVLHLKSPLTRWSEKMYRPDRWDTYWQKYKTSCPCCRRPLDLEITMSSSVDEQPWTPHHPRGSGHAFVTALWGANAGYALGALALGIRLRELSPHIKRVIIHTDDVPSNYLDAFKKDNLWQLRKVDYIDGVSDLYVSKGNIFDGVFTKLAAWTLDEYSKVLLLDLDIIPLKPLDQLFELPCPAAMVRGHGKGIHGSQVDGSRFFASEDCPNYPWGQSGGINAGVILLQPDHYLFQQMLSEVSSKNHPCHVAGSGPEQDYLSRFFAARKESPWHHISVAWNYQLHQSLFAIERVLEWTAFMPSERDFSEEEKEWLPDRLKMNLEDIGVVHFSGEVKMWHRILEATATDSSERDDQRREVSHTLANRNGEDGGNGDVVFAERLMSSQYGHSLWISKTAEPEDYLFYGCRREGQKIFAGGKDITLALDWMVKKVLAVAVTAAQNWNKCYKDLAVQDPGLLDTLQKPCVPEGCFKLGTRVEVSWMMGQGSGATVIWLPAQVIGVHADSMDYIVRFETWGDWGDTERHVQARRVRPLTPDKEQGDGWVWSVCIVRNFLRYVLYNVAVVQKEFVYRVLKWHADMPYMLPKDLGHTPQRSHDWSWEQIMMYAVL